MASIRITIETDNAAFHGADGAPDHLAVGAEVGRILHRLAMDCTGCGVRPALLSDINGNTVGKVEVTE